MTALLLLLAVAWLVALGTLATVHGRYWRRVHQSRIVWALLLLGSVLLPADAAIARLAVVALLVAFFVFAARPAIRARRADVALRREAEREARRGTTT